MIVDDVFSLVTVAALLNTTTLNQGDHCIIAISQDPAHPPVEFGNLSVQYNQDLCQQMEKQFEGRLLEILKNIGL